MTLAKRIEKFQEWLAGYISMWANDPPDDRDQLINALYDIKTKANKLFPPDLEEEPAILPNDSAVVCITKILASPQGDEEAYVVYVCEEFRTPAWCVPATSNIGEEHMEGGLFYNSREAAEAAVLGAGGRLLVRREADGD